MAARFIECRRWLASLPEKGGVPERLGGLVADNATRREARVGLPECVLRNPDTPVADSSPAPKPPRLHGPTEADFKGPERQNFRDRESSSATRLPLGRDPQ